MPDTIMIYNDKYIFLMRNVINMVGEIKSTGEAPIPKPVSYVGIKPVDSMVAEDSGFYNVD